MGTEFNLSFPAIDELMEQIVRVGRGAHIYKVDVSCAFRHLKIDPGDYDLLGLNWQGVNVDTCVLFGSRHGSQFFSTRQRRSAFYHA